LWKIRMPLPDSRDDALMPPDVEAVTAMLAARFAGRATDVQGS
jgi:hypothetical protein